MLQREDLEEVKTCSLPTRFPAPVAREFLGHGCWHWGRDEAVREGGMFEGRFI